MNWIIVFLSVLVSFSGALILLGIFNFPKMDSEDDSKKWKEQVDKLSNLYSKY